MNIFIIINIIIISIKNHLLLLIVISFTHDSDNPWNSFFNYFNDF